MPKCWNSDCHRILASESVEIFISMRNCHSESEFQALKTRINEIAKELSHPEVNDSTLEAFRDRLSKSEFLLLSATDEEIPLLDKAL